MTAVSPLFSVLYLHKTLLVSASVTIDQTVIWNRCKQNKRSKNFDNRLHCRGDFSLGKFNVTLDCFCSWPIRMLATGNSARCVWENPVVIPLKIALCVAASEPPSYSWFLGPTQSQQPKQHHLQYSRFCRAHVCDRQTTLLHV